jgi:Right handed beta helix region
MPILPDFCTAVVLAIPFAAALAQAATFYVANGGANGRPCTESQPCATIAQAATRMQAGDTVYLRGGTYTEEVNAGTRLPSGTSDSQRTLVAGYPGETVRFVGGGFNLYFPPDGPHELAYVTFDNFIMDGSLAYGMLGPKVHHITFSNSERLNAPGGAGVGAGFGTHHNQFINLHVHHNGPTRAGDHSGNPGSPGGHGFYICGQFTTVRGCDVHDNGNYGMQIFDSGNIGCADDSVVDQNHFHDNRTGDGAMTVNYGSRVRITNNRVSHNQGDGIAVTYGQPEGVLLCGNTITDNSGTAISIGAGVKNTVLRGNTLARNSRDLDDRGTGTTAQGASAGDCPVTSTEEPAKKRPAPRNLRVVTKP